MQQQRFYFNQLFAPILIVYILFAPHKVHASRPVQTGGMITVTYTVLSKDASLRPLLTKKDSPQLSVHPGAICKIRS